MFQRRRQDPSFDAVLERVERAKAALLAAVPSPRGKVAVPLAEALLRYEDGLRAALGEIEGWNGEHRRDCRLALNEALSAADRLRVQAPALDYEAMVYALDDLIAPLDVFAAAERAIRRAT